MSIQQQSNDAVAWFDQATLTHHSTIERVILAMHEHLHEPLSLDEMAEIAYLSPYYFNRLFHRMIGLPPGEFLAALRLNAAKQLLLTSSASVTDICFDLGYASLGSFTTRFTQLVGLSPRQLRLQADSFEPDLTEPLEPFWNVPARAGGSVSGLVMTPPGFRGRAYVGLFTKPIPQGPPVRCTSLLAPGSFQISGIPTGLYYLFCAAPSVAGVKPYQETLVAVAPRPILIQRGQRGESVILDLRAARITDPPLLVGIPYV